MIAILGVLFVLSAANPLVHSCTQEEVITCMRAYMDANADGAVDEAEWNEFILYHPCRRLFNQVIPGHYVMDECDVDGDGVLNATDFAHRLTCVSYMRWEEICLYCTGCELILNETNV